MSRALCVKNLNYAFNEDFVLKDISFSVTRGEFLIIIGPNGSGKTTLMRILAGIEKLVQGSLEIMNKDINLYSKKILSRTLAFVPQTISIDFPFTVSQVVLMGRSPYTGILGLEGSSDLKIANQAMEFTRTLHLAGRKLHQLSGGELQRVFIAKAICQEPEILLLDEPTSALDLSHQIQVMDLMLNLKKERNLTVVMVSHDVNLAAMYADSMLILKNGEITGYGPPKDVMTYKILEDVYQCRLLLDNNPLGGCPRVTPVPKRFLDNKQ